MKHQELLLDLDEELQEQHISYMKKCLLSVSLSGDAPAINNIQTKSFFEFIKSDKKDLSKYFHQDNFSGRIHTPITSLIPELSNCLLIDGKETSGVDVSQMQPMLLAKVLFENIGHNQFTAWINNGWDVYKVLQEKAHLNNRKEAKNRFYEIIFNPPSKDLAEMFGNSSWIDWINNYKSKYISSNPHSRNKPHSNLAWILQKKEVEVMTKIWKCLIRNKITFLTKHDEVICKKSDINKVVECFNEILSEEFKQFKINIK